MSIDSKVEVVPGELAQIVDSVFRTMLNLEVDACEASSVPGDDRLTSVVHLAGDWNGAVLMECSRGQARRFAGHFLTIDPPETVDDDVRDVLGELANMIGGNLKCVLASGIRLSSPSVVDGGDYSLRICGVEGRQRMAFQCAEGLFWVSVVTTRA
ncbi:MAG: chemotaxis protein CheX [Bryobacteraceae bacterium]